MLSLNWEEYTTRNMDDECTVQLLLVVQVVVEALVKGMTSEGCKQEVLVVDLQIPRSWCVAQLVFVFGSSSSLSLVYQVLDELCLALVICSGSSVLVELRRSWGCSQTVGMWVNRRSLCSVVGRRMCLLGSVVGSFAIAVLLYG